MTKTTILMTSNNSMKTLTLLVTIGMMGLAPAVGTPNAFAAADTLPGGTAIEVTIDDSVGGQMFFVPPGGGAWRGGTGRGGAACRG